MARNNTDAKKSFVLYVSYWKHMKKLDDHQLAQLTRAIFAHAMGENGPELDDRTDMAFGFISDQMDRDRESYEGTIERRREAGRKGGVTKASNAKQSVAMPSNAKQCQAMLSNAKQSVAMLSNAKQTLANVADNDNDNEDENVNEDDDVNVTVNDDEVQAALAAISTGGSKHRTKFSNFPERTYTNFDELERLLLNAD